jgi:hypothetical protein
LQDCKIPGYFTWRFYLNSGRIKVILANLCTVPPVPPM